MGKRRREQEALRAAQRAAAQQQILNKEAITESALVDQTNQITPFGSLTYTGTPGIDRTSTLELSPGVQALIDSQLSTSQGLTDQANIRLGQLTSDPFDINQAGGQRVGSEAIRRMEQRPLMGAYDRGGPIQTQLRDAGSFQRSLDPRGAIRGGIDPSGAIRRGIDPSGDIRRDFGPSGDLQRSIGTTGAVGLTPDQQYAREQSISGLGRLPGQGDFLSERERVEEALYNRQSRRITPQFDRDIENTITKLANQGITEYSNPEAFQEALRPLIEGRTDALESASLSAIGGAGQEQTRLFEDQLRARQQGFGELGALSALENQARQQRFGQGAQAGAFGNEAQRQAFEQQAARAAFGNQAQQQGFAQDAARMDAANQAQQQVFAQNAARTAAANQAQQQQFAQQAARGAYGNQAQQQAYQQNLASAGFANTAQEQQTQQNMAAADFFNTAQGNRLAQDQAIMQGDLATGQFGNQARDAWLQELILQRNQPFNELSAFLTGAPAAPTPTFTQGPGFQMQGADLIGAQENYYDATQGGGGMWGALGKLGSAAITRYCWVAREIYGVDNPKWLIFRSWMLNDAPRWFRALYLKYGERIAAFISNKPRLKTLIKIWMDTKITTKIDEIPIPSNIVINFD